jgi:hypothetical protein
LHYFFFFSTKLSDTYNLLFIKKLPVYLFIYFLTACSGYRVVDHNNPFRRFGIKKISIPTFVSYASIPGVSAPFTAEIFRTLASYSSLKSVSGVDTNSDAVLLGIIDSKKINETVKTTDDTIITQGNRRKFYVPSSTTVYLQLNLVLIKNPVWINGVVHVKKSLQKKSNSVLIFNKTLELSEKFSREVNIERSDMVVNYTKNSGLLRKNIQDMAEIAADRFRNEIINAF